MANITKKTRLFVAQRGQFCCEYCMSQAKYSPDYFSIEHIIPQIKNGTDAVTNLAYACLACNNHKYVHVEALDPITGLLIPLYHPRLDNWEAHFCWSDDYSILTGITPKGRATVDKLKLNRSSLINLRLVLAAISKHPPY
jgi:hypothetical protein